MAKARDKVEGGEVDIELHEKMATQSTPINV